MTNFGLWIGAGADSRVALWSARLGAGTDFDSTLASGVRSVSDFGTGVRR
ncbi:MAG TPA: hypothetical protein VG028_14905 [Terriglobia bacterium]|nr:hypothetical protein [Terriglobia bacterium]